MDEVNAPAPAPELEAPVEETAAAPIEQAEAPQDAPQEELKPEAAPSEEPNLFELPDGRKVDAETLSKEWRDNFMPEFTRRSQALAEARKQPEPAKTEAPPWEDPEWVPTSWKEGMEIAEMKVWQKIQEEATREEREAKAREEYVAKEVEYIKGLDPNADINQVMSYAAKRSHTSLVTAYQALQDIEEAARRAEDRVQRNLKTRLGEPVGTSTQAVPQVTEFPPDVKSGLEKALYVIRNK